jgi:hypothetical protein
MHQRWKSEVPQVPWFPHAHVTGELVGATYKADNIHSNEHGLVKKDVNLYISNNGFVLCSIYSVIYSWPTYEAKVIEGKRGMYKS